ncbi:MAG: hydroxymethylbilane synthase [Clostridia bacterium]|nr:hydroxymethylbilane synthase [Clostridia bacterium]
MKIRIGTRKSRLALVQTNMAAAALKRIDPRCETEIVPISTTGDKRLDKPLTEIGGKGVFVSEIERALQSGRIDIAVHSAKDLPITIAEGLEISAVLERGNYRDVLVTRKGTGVRNSGDFIIGTGSMRRRCNLKQLYPAIGFADIRGNVDTRLNKLRDGQYDGIILAAAGLERAGLDSLADFDYKPFDYTEFLPAPCQGIIAVESRINDSLVPVLKEINDKRTYIAFETERYIINRLGGDCTMPIGAYSYAENKQITIAASKDGSSDHAQIAKGDITDRFDIAEWVISRL